MTEELIEIHFSTSDLEKARQISLDLVKKKLAACAQIIPLIESTYIWKGEIETSKESKLILKTRKSLFETVSSFLQKESGYEIPEIVQIPIQKASSSYLNWVLEATEGHLEPYPSDI